MASFTGKSPFELLTIGSNVANIIGDTGTNPYGVSKALIDALNAAEAALSTAITAQVAAQIAEKAATETKTLKKANVVASLNAVQTAAAANPAVTDEMLTAIGFSRRRSGPRPQPATPAGVAGLTAAPQANGTVKLKWERSGNGQNTMFVVETSEDGVSWTMIKSTTRVSYTAEGFAPGAPAWFRVTATTSVAASPPSLPVAVYAPGSARNFTKADLKIAA